MSSRGLGEDSRTTHKASSSKNPVLMRVTFDAGHGIGSTRTQVDQQLTDEYAYILWRTGAKG